MAPGAGERLAGPALGELQQALLDTPKEPLSAGIRIVLSLATS
jgi:hypothetical protein